MKYLESLERELDSVFFKEALLTRLHTLGIPELNISIKMASEKVSDKKKSFVGFYI